MTDQGELNELKEQIFKFEKYIQILLK